MDEQRVKSVIESVLFVSDRPVSPKDIADILGEGFDTKSVRKYLEEMMQHYESQKGGILLREVAGGFQLYTNPENAEYLKKLIDIKPFRLSRAALETLAIVAYRQPVTKAEIEDIRGVDSSGALRVLIERKLVKIIGKKDEPGRPFLYGTTKEFLEFFDLKSLGELPTLKDLDQIAREINEESGAASVKTSQESNTSVPIQIPNNEPLVSDIKDKEEDEKIQEETAAAQLEEAIKKIEQSNKTITESLGLTNVEKAEENQESLGINTLDNNSTGDNQSDEEKGE